MMATTKAGKAREERILKYLLNGCGILGFCIAIIASRGIGMAAGAIPWVTAALAVLWVGSLVLGFFAFGKGKKAPAAGTPLWLKLAGFFNAYSSLYLTFCILTGYLFWPSVSVSHVAQWNPYFLMISLFVMGLAIDFTDWKRIVMNPRVIGLSALTRWALMPIAAYVVGSIVFVALVPGNAGKMLAVGLILLGSAPTGTASNALTMIAKGDLALSVSVTTVNTLLAAILLPLSMRFLAGSMATVHAGALFEDLLYMVVIPVASGSIVGSIFVRQCKNLRPTFAPIAVICLGLIMMGTMSKGSDVLIKQLYILLYLFPGCILFATVGYSIGFFVPRLFGFTIPQRIAACYEVGVDNAALTMTLAFRHFGPMAALVSIVYSKIMVIGGSVVLAPLFRRIAEKQEAKAAALAGAVPKQGRVASQR
jgi:bile acid:Na+ symporter, BASS family